MSKKIQYQEVDKDTYNRIYSQYYEGNEKEDFHTIQRYYVNKELLKDE